MTKKGNILILGGKESIFEALGKKLIQIGYNVEEFFDRDTALEKLENKEFEVVLLNSELADINANIMLKTIKNTHPLTEVIIFAEHGTMRSAFNSMRLGAYDYLIKPFDLNKATLIIERALGHWYKSTKWLTLEQIAEYLQLSTSSIYKMAQAGKIPGYKIGTQWRFKREEIDIWAESMKPVIKNQKET